MSNHKGPITAGVDHNYFERITVSNTSFSTEADVIYRFKGNYFVTSLINEGNVTIQYSFNGNTVHGDLVPNTPSEALAFEGRPISKIWFKVDSGSADVRVEAWSR